MSLLLSLVVAATLATATPQCDVPEQQVIDTLADKSDWPERTYVVLEGDKLAQFFVNLTNSGLLAGTLYLVDKVYIIDAKSKQGAIPKVWLFFIQDGCVLAKLVADKPAIQDLIPR